MRQQWFTHVRLLIAHPPRYSETSTAALTTPALDRRSLRWFGISACTATPEDLPPSLAQHGSCRRSSTSSSSLPFRTHVGAENSAVVVDLPRCGPMLSPRVPSLVPIPGRRVERVTPGQRLRPNYGHPQGRRLHRQPRLRLRPDHQSPHRRQRTRPRQEPRRKPTTPSASGPTATRCWPPLGSAARSSPTASPTGSANQPKTSPPSPAEPTSPTASGPTATSSGSSTPPPQPSTPTPSPASAHHPTTRRAQATSGGTDYDPRVNSPEWSTAGSASRGFVGGLWGTWSTTETVASSRNGS